MKSILRSVSVFVLLSALQIVNAQVINDLEPMFKYLLVRNSEINTNGDDEIQISEAESYKGDLELVFGEQLHLRGIEYFTGIKSLKVVMIRSPWLPEGEPEPGELPWMFLDFRNNVSIERIELDGCVVNWLDISNATSLKTLKCIGFDSRLEMLDMGNNSALDTMHLTNHMIFPDLVACPALKSLSLGNSGYGNIDFGNCLDLTELSLESFSLSNLDLSRNEVLKKLVLYGGTGSSIDLSSNINLIELNISNSKLLESLDLSNNIKLKKLVCERSSLLSLDLSSNPELIYLGCNYSRSLKTLNLEGNTKLSKLDCSGCALIDLNLINNKELVTLDCGRNDLIDIDLKDNIKLTYLDCKYNYASSLNVTENVALEKLICNNNSFTALDLSNNVELSSIDCSNNQLKVLDIRNGNTSKIEKLNYKSNGFGLKCISVSDVEYARKNLKIETEIASFCRDCNNPIVVIPDEKFKSELLGIYYLDADGDGEIQVSEAEAYTGIIHLRNTGVASLKGLEAFTSISKFQCFDEPLLKEVDISANTKLKQLWVSDNPALDTVIVNENPGLEDVILKNNDALNYLDFSNCLKLNTLSCDQNSYLKGLNLGNCSSLISLSCDDNWSLIDLFLGGCDSLEVITCRSESKLKELDLRKNKKLKNISFYGSSIVKIDVSNCEDLERIYCRGSENLEELNVEGCTSLNYVYALECSKIKELDLSSSKSLNKLCCTSKELTRLNLRNGNNKNIESLEILKAESLNCISVDDVDYSYENWSDITAQGISFSTDCDVVISVIDMGLNTTLVNNPKINLNGDTEIQLYEAEAFSGTLNISNQSIANLSGLEAFINMTGLNCSGNALNAIDLSQYPQLAYLDCSNNPLTSLTNGTSFPAENPLKASQANSNTNLTYLDCSNTGLTTLDVSSYAKLETLLCHDNSLTELLLSQNTKLTTLACQNNSLQDLKLDANAALESLNCNGNSIYHLVLTQNSLLTTLHCTGNEMGCLNFPTTSALKEIDCSDNIITGIEADNLSALTKLNCSNNSLERLNIRNGTNHLMEEFLAGNNANLSCISVDDVAFSTTNWTNINAGTSFSENCEMLAIVDIPDVNFKEYLINESEINTNGDGEIQVEEARAYTGFIYLSNVDVADLTGLEEFVSMTKLTCTGNPWLGSIDITANADLLELNCSDNPSLTEIVGIEISVLQKLYCNNTYLENLDISTSQIIELHCSGNRHLEAIDVRDCSSLMNLNCSGNSLTQLDVSGCTSLDVLNCSGNLLTQLDVSDCGMLVELNCSNNDLIQLDIRNGNNEFMADIQAVNNPDLTCVSVSDVAWASDYWSGIDAGVTFNTDCSVVTSTPDMDLVTIQLFPNPTTGELTVEWDDLEGAIIKVVSNSGRIILQRDVQSRKEVINLSNAASGLYLVLIEKGGEIIHKEKVIKK